MKSYIGSVIVFFAIALPPAAARATENPSTPPFEMLFSGEASGDISLRAKLVNLRLLTMARQCTWQSATRTSLRRSIPVPTSHRAR